MNFNLLKHKYQDPEPGSDGGGGGGGGGGEADLPTTNWRDTLPDDIKANPSLANFQDIGQMAKSYVEMKSFQGDSIRVPGQDAGEEDRVKFTEKLIEKAPNVMIKPDFDNSEQSNEFWRTIGKPEKPDQYGVPEIKDLPENFQQNTDRLDFFRNVAHGANLTKSQFNEVMSAVTQQDIANAQAGADAQKAAMEGLNQEWGMATKERMDKVLSLAEKTKAPDHVIEAIKNQSIPVDIIKWIHGLSESLGDEGTNLVNNDSSQNGAMTPGEAQDKIDEIYRNKDHAFHRGDKAAMDRMLELVAAANPGSSSDINDLYKGSQFKVG